MTEVSLFHEALAKPAGQRAAFLDVACANEPQRRAAVEALLAAHDASTNLLGRPPADVRPDVGRDPHRPAVTTVYQPLCEPGAVVGGRYTLVERIGEGGMGEVWVAKQTEPIKRKVALKLIKAGMDSKAVLQRFDQERQALALMDHPNIAKVLDGGVSGDHRPFFVMELVNGLPLTKFCDQMKLRVRERLELFTPICHAVQHAHQKGIVHRDLKPSNILVTIIDGKPLPKVIDFGVAKATSGKLTDETMSTGFGAVVGTLEYMAPEQAGFAGADIDTRADIYSLGVILYELLTGLRPIDGKRLRKAALSEMVRILEEEVPSKPSTRLSTDESLPSLAALRQIEPKKLMAMLRGELDWVVMKCLEKQRDRRYETANGLARDLQRYLADEPVEARPPSAGYRFHKFVRRHKGSAIAASLVLAALVTGMAGTTWQWIRAEQALADEARQRAAAEANEQKANAAADGERLAKLDAQVKEQLAVAAAEKEKAARLEEERQRKFAEAISRFVQDDFLALTSVEGQDRFGGEGKEALSKDTTLGQLLDRAAGKLRARKDLDPRIEAELCLIVGVNYRGAGDARMGIEFIQRAVELRERLLGHDHFSTLDAMNSLGVAFSAAGQYDRAVALHEETLALQKSTLGRDFPSTLVTMSNLAKDYVEAGKLEAAVALFEETLALQQARLGPDDPHTLLTMNNLAEAYQLAGKIERAVPLFEETITLQKARLGPDHRSTLTSINNLAGAYVAAGKPEVALPLYEETLRIRKAKLGPDHPDTLVTMNDLAIAYEHTGKLEAALPLHEETLQLVTARLGPGHPHTLVSMDNLATAYRAANKLELAVPLAEKTLQLRKANLGLEHPETLIAMTNLATTYSAAHKLDLALPMFERTLPLKRAKLGPDHPHTLTCMGNLAEAYAQAGKLEAALPLYEELLKLRKAKLGSDHPDTLMTMRGLGDAYGVADKLELAVPLLEETHKLQKVKLGPDHPQTLTSMNNLGVVYLKAKKLDMGLPLLEETLRGRNANLGADHPDTLASMYNLAKAYAEAGKLEGAVPLYEEMLRLTKAKLGGEHPETLVSMNNLGLAYHDAGKPEAAVPLFAEALKLMKANLGPDHPNTVTTLGNLAVALDAVNRFDEAEPFHRERLALVKQTFGAESTDYANALAQFSLNLLVQRKWTDAEPILRECLAIREKIQPNVWSTFNSKSQLGGALLGQKKFAEVEPLLLAGYEGLKQREKTIPPTAKVRLRETLERLVQLFEATDKKDEAVKWRQELEAFNAVKDVRNTDSR
jgi:serine/threonine protein kinase/tetratricopeptide (TPR) repeat protein